MYVQNNLKGLKEEHEVLIQHDFATDAFDRGCFEKLLL